MSFKLYLKIDGLTTRDGIQLQSFDWGLANTNTTGIGSGAGTGKVQLQDLVVIKQTDKSTPSLVKACATGKHFQKLNLSAIDFGDEGGGNFDDPIIKLDLGDITFNSYKLHGSVDGESAPLEELSISYAKFEIIS